MGVQWHTAVVSPRWRSTIEMRAVRRFAWTALPARVRLSDSSQILCVEGWVERSLQIAPEKRRTSAARKLKDGLGDEIVRVAG